MNSKASKHALFRGTNAKLLEATWQTKYVIYEVEKNSLMEQWNWYESGSTALGQCYFFQVLASLKSDSEVIRTSLFRPDFLDGMMRDEKCIQVQNPLLPLSD